MEHRYINRREFLEVGALLGAGTLSGVSCLRAPDPASLEPVPVLARKLYDSLEGPAKRKGYVPYDHPLRQWHNRGVRLSGVDVSDLDGAQETLVHRLLYSGLSQRGRELVPQQFFLRWGGLRTLRLLIAGNPNTPDYQIILSGPHLNLRLGGKNREGVAFGGPLVYGDQRGDGEPKLPGNVYQFQFHRARELFERLDPDQKRRAVIDRAPIQTRIELQGDAGVFAGVPVRELSSRARRDTEDLVLDITRTFAVDDIAYAATCLGENGGVESLYLSYYREGDPSASGAYQIFRLEGPSAVLYFRGFPHVHAFVNIGMDGNAPMSVGEELGLNRVVLEGEALKRFFERAMQSHVKTDAAFYDSESLVGRLRLGVIRTGDIYNLESWGNGVSVVSIRGSRLVGYASDDVRRQVGPVEPDRIYTIATSSYLASEECTEAFGRGDVEETGTLLRDATIAYVKRHGFDSGLASEPA